MLVSSGNVTQLAEACARLLADPILSEKMGQEGYKKAMEEWSWDHIADQLLASFKKAVN